MKVFTVVIRNVTEKLNKHTRKHCQSEEFRAGALFFGVVAAELVFWSWLYCFGSLLPGQPVL
jgi:hypothetical protein